MGDHSMAALNGEYNLLKGIEERKNLLIEV